MTQKTEVHVHAFHYTCTAVDEPLQEKFPTSNCIYIFDLCVGRIYMYMYMYICLLIHACIHTHTHTHTHTHDRASSAGERGRGEGRGEGGGGGRGGRRTRDQL